MRYKWKVTRIEQRVRNRDAVFLVLGTLFTLIISVSAEEGFSVGEIGQILGVVLVLIILFLIINRFFPYKEYTYEIDEKGLLISKGRKSQMFQWGEFSRYYNLTQYIERNDKRNIHSTSSVNGSILYLELKKKRFGRAFVVVRTESDNTEQVCNLLQEHVQEDQYSYRDDWGYKKYILK